ncbi:MAG TPA: hypothetical protein PLM81_02535 [Ginsengibacter sp.]|nr:hypothetical protein [Ginsengibacter sp.]HRP44064.1 hypothetical protein [Ginsengibacter sp.]
MNILLIILLIIAGTAGFLISVRLAAKSDRKALQPKEIPGCIPATGIITDFYKGGGKYSQPSGGLDYVYKMFKGLEITDQSSNNWEAHTYEFVRESQFNIYRIGDTLHVKYDPADKNNVVLDGDFHKRYQP